MGFPSPKDIYGNLKYKKEVYNLKNRFFTKEQEKKIIEFMQKNHIEILPFFPHIPKNFFTNYVVIDNKLYISKINYGNIGLSNDFTSKDIFGKELEECNFDVTLNAVEKSISFIMNRSKYYKQWIKYFYFKNGILEKIEDDIEYNTDIRKVIELKNINLEKIKNDFENNTDLRKITDLEEHFRYRYYIGLFWVIDKKIFSAKQLLDDVIHHCEIIKFPLSFEEIIELFSKKYNYDINPKELIKGSVVYDKNSQKFIITVNKKINIDLVVEEFDIKHKEKEIFFNSNI